VEVNKHNFVAPVPGMSLTTEPKSRPWESPPQMTKVSEVVNFYSERLSNPDLMYSILDAVKKGIPIHDIALSMAKVSVMNGKHTVDTGMIVSPVITEMIKAVADLNDVGYVLTQEDTESTTTVSKALATEAIREVKASAKEVKEEEQKTGLMSRGKKDE
jgi:hypothetical protein